MSEKKNGKKWYVAAGTSFPSPKNSLRKFGKQDSSVYRLICTVILYFYRSIRTGLTEADRLEIWTTALVEKREIDPGFILFTVVSLPWQAFRL